MSAAERPPLAGPSAEVQVLRLERGKRPTRKRDRVAGEEPLEIRVGGPGQPFTQLAVTMRTPAHSHSSSSSFTICFDDSSQNSWPSSFSW